ncbi:MAG: ATP-dependent RecD-like DNA helicase [Clostridiales bacterium]|nr:ATP-dependent RecD-like DNA helicase [Candidatus Apopatousia equi]
MFISGEIDSIVFRNEENGYTVLDLDSNGELLTCVGKFPSVSGGERVELEGDFVKNKYGNQFATTKVKVLPPNSCDGIVKYLSSGLIKGIGPVTAQAIVDKFGADTLYIMEFNPDKLAEVRGVSKQKAITIAKTFYEVKSMQNAVMFLQSYNITTNLAVKIYKTYQDNTEEVVKTNPYKLVEDVDGIGFSTADKIAQKIGIPANSDFRFRAGILHILKENSEKSGNTYILKKNLITNLYNLLNVEENEEKIDSILTSLTFDGQIKQFDYEDEQCVMLAKFFKIESSIASKLVALKHKYSDTEVDLSQEISEYEMLNGIELHSHQKDAVQMAVNSGASIITGGPGTGKTTIVKCILSCLKKQRKSVILLAPTGRAAKRLSESTGEDAKTIHRALDLDYKNGNGMFNTLDENNPLKQDVIIVDEVSMVDAQLMFHLLKAIKPFAQLIMVGDKDQLPSVGAGNVLADILSSGVIPVCMLTEIYRQDAKSYIITNAHLINNGKMPILDNTSKDFFYSNIVDPEQMLFNCVNMVTMRLPKFAKTEAEKIQVLAPMKAGACGVDNLNKELQKVINPSNLNKKEIITEFAIYREGDKVMQTVNNYEQEWTRLCEDGLNESGLGVFNGDIGKIEEINLETGEITVLFEDGRKAIYPRISLSELVLSYAITIHKSQGSEFDVVVIPIVSGASMILTRNLLYTAVTRAKKLVVLVGAKFNIKRMIDNDYTVKRYSMLKQYLIDEQTKFDTLYGNN